MIWIVIVTVVLFLILGKLILGKIFFNLSMNQLSTRRLVNHAISERILEELGECRQEAINYYVVLRSEYLMFVRQKEAKERQVRRLMGINAPPNQLAELARQIAELDAQILRINDYLTRLKNQIQNIVSTIHDINYINHINHISQIYTDSTISIYEHDSKRTQESDEHAASGTPVFTAEGGFKIVPGEPTKVDDAELQRRLERLIFHESPDNLNN